MRNSEWKLILMISAGLLGVSQSYAQTFTTDVTITTGNSPSLSLVQDTSQGSNATLWRVQGSGLLQFYSSASQSYPIEISGQAPLDSLYIDDLGHIGLGTTVTTANDLSIRARSSTVSTALYSQDKTRSFVTQLSSAGTVSFSLGQNQSRTTPFMIAPGAPDATLQLDSSGNLGLGTTNPMSLLHGYRMAAVGSENLARFEVSDDLIGRLDINNATTTDGAFIPRIQGRSGSTVAALITEGLVAGDTGLNPVIVYNAARIAGGSISNRPLVVYRNNNVAKVTIAANGNITATAFTTASSRSLKQQISTLDSRKALSALQQLSPVEFVYKDDPTRDGRVGFIAEDVPDLVAEPARKSVAMMDVLAVVTSVVKDQQQTIDRQQALLAEQAATMGQQQQQLSQLRQEVSRQSELMKSLANKLGHDFGHD